jgi:hypothetical protein
LLCRFVLHRAAEIHLLGHPAKKARKKKIHKYCDEKKRQNRLLDYTNILQIIGSNILVVIPEFVIT